MAASPSRASIRRVLIWLALLASVIGVLLGQALVTWLNAALLCLSCIGIQ